MDALERLLTLLLRGSLLLCKWGKGSLFNGEINLHFKRNQHTYMMIKKWRSYRITFSIKEFRKLFWDWFILQLSPQMNQSGMWWESTVTKLSTTNTTMFSIKWVTLIGMNIIFEEFTIGIKQTYEIGKFVTKSTTIVQYWRIKLTIGNMRLLNECFCFKKNGLFLVILNNKYKGKKLTKSCS